MLVVTDAAGVVAAHPLRFQPTEAGPVFGSLSATASLDVAREGDFALEVRLGGETVTRVPFSLEARSSGDPFDPAATWVREGRWHSLGYLAQPHDDPDDPLAFAFRASSRELPGGAERASLSLRLRRDGHEVAATNADAVLVNEGWTGYRRELFSPDGRDSFRLSDLHRRRRLRARRPRRRRADQDVPLPCRGRRRRAAHAERPPHGAGPRLPAAEPAELERR